MRYLLTGDELTGTEAHRLGLIQELTEPGKVLDRAIEIATDISKRAPLGVMAALKSARIASVEGPEANLRGNSRPHTVPYGVVSFIPSAESGLHPDRPSGLPAL